MNYKFRNKEFSTIRYPKSDNKSLKAWNAADEHILKYIDENSITDEGILLYNDRFGFLSSFLIESSPKIIIESKSQEKAINSNFDFNKLDLTKCKTFNPLDELQSKVELCVVKIPKSMDLFRLYLQQLSEAMYENSKVICGFMTKYFTPQMLDIANEYFEKVEQSLAWKKSRLLILSKPKEFAKSAIINEIKLDDNTSLKQYFGVFSGKNIDYATQFLIEHLNFKETDNRVLDLGSGNGVLAFAINKKNVDCEIHLVDDSILAIESAKLNLKGENIHFSYSDNLEKYEDNYFDFIVSNPPFHFEHETNIEIATTLFKEAKRCLKTDGHFQLVANKHLNYKTHLDKIFKSVEITAQNEKYIVYECFK
jgi:23S rRNA (guanine1835-N2)-methyltransferase